MTHWPFVESLALFAIGKRLGLWLIGIAGYCVVAGILSDWWGIHVPYWGSAASLINTIILGLLMSFRNRAAYARWWEAREQWGRLTNDSRNLAAKLAAFVPAEALARARVADLLAGFADALNRHLRGEEPRLQNVPGFTHEHAEPPHVPLYLAARLYATVADWRRAGIVDGTTLWIIDAHLRGLLEVCGACERIRNTPLSPAYKSLLRTGLALDILAEPWLTVADFGLWSVPLFLLVCFFLLGVELIDTVIEEPFGREPDDLDLDRYCHTIRASVQATLPPAGKKE